MASGGNITVGQAWMVTGTSQPDIDLTIQRAWYNLKSLYNITTNTCLSPGACDMHKQVRNSSYVEIDFKLTN